MKCPKCGYTSFDYNLACPKCNKDVSLEQEKLNVPAFKPDPPRLLGGLMGESQHGTHLSGSGEEPNTSQEPALSIENAAEGRPPGEGLDDSQEIDLDLELHEDKDSDVEGILEEPGKEMKAGASPAVSAEDQPSEPEKTEILGEISLEEAKVFPESKGGGDQEEISLDLDEITLEAAQPGEKSSGKEPDTRIENELGDFSLEDAGVTLEQAAPPLSSTEPLELDLDNISLGDMQAPSGKEMDEITLSLEDLKVNETGQLEIGRHIAAPTATKEPAPRKPSAMQAPPESTLTMDKESEDDLSLLLNDDSIEIPAEPAEGIQAIDLENLDLELDLEAPDRKGNS